MTDYTWPAIIPTASEWSFVANTTTFRSPFTGQTRTYERAGGFWACSLTANNLKGDQRAVLRAFLSKLRGQAHRVIIPDHAYVRRGALTENFLVNGGSQTGTSLVCDGATAGVTNAMRDGDWITLGSNLHMVTADVNTNGSGQLTLSITPPLRTSPANDSTVEIVSPTCRMMLAENTIKWTNSPGGMSSFAVDLMEDIT